MISLLIVDYESQLLELTKTYLKKTGDFTVGTAPSAREALEMMETTTYDAIVSNYQMPEIDGIEFLKTIRGSGSDIPFIIFTGKGREDVVIEALNAGADFYLQKGGHPKAQFAELTGMIKHSVERNQAKASEGALSVRNKRLEKSEERYRNVVEGQTELISRFLPNGTHVFVNEAYCHYFGKRREEIMGHRFVPAIPSEDQELVKNHFASLTTDHPVDTIEHRIIMPDGEVRWQSWSNRAIFDEKGTVIEYQSVGRDITELKMAEAAVRQKLEFEETLAAAISRFTGIYDFDDAVNGALADMGRLSRADRDYLCLLRKGGTVLDNTHEWCAKGVSPQIDNLQNIPSEMFPWWTEKIRNREIIHITDVSKLPPEAEAEREILEMQEIRSLIVLPVFCGDEPAGFLGFDSIRETGEWTEEVILRTVAEIIGKSLELKRMQSVLEESKERFRSLATSTPVAVMIYRDDRFMYANPAAEEISGYSEAELCQMNIWDIVHPDYVNLIKERGRARQRGEKTVNRYEFKIITKTGKEKWVEISGDTIVLDGHPAGIISLLNITERKQAEEELQRSENLYRTIFESTSAPTVILGEDTTILLANSAYENLSGFSKDEVEGKKSWTGFVVKEDLERMREYHRLRRSSPGSAPRNYEFRFIEKCGDLHEIYLTIQIIPGTKKSVASLLDITERKAAKARIDHYNSVLLAIRDLNQLITHETDPVCLITQTPEVLTRTGGYHNVWIATIDDSGHVAAAAESGLGEVLFRHMRDRLDTGDFPGCVRSAMAGEAAVVVTEDPAAACPDCPLSATCSPGRGVMTTRVESGGRVYGVISITVPSAFVNVENEQALFMEAATDIAFALHTMDLEEERAAAHQTMMDIIEFLPDATFVIDRDGRVITWNRAIEEMTGIKAKDMIGKGDHEYAIPFYGTRRAILIDLAFACEDEHWLRDHYSHIRKEGDILIADTTLPRPLGRRSVLMGTASPLYNGNGRVMGAIESIRDITDRKAAEHALEMANKKLQLLSGVTRHDILNQVTGLAGYTDLLGEVLPDDPDMRKYIDRITEATSAIENQITFTRDYEHLGMDPSRWQHVADAAELAASGYADRGVNVSIGTGALEIFSDPMLGKVFYNLFENAVRHGKHVTEITVTCREEEGRSVVITVEDDGVGIQVEIKEKIFRHGFGKHTGYGLFLAQEILAITGMSIQETGEEGKGARFEITVPPGGWRMSHSEGI